MTPILTSESFRLGLEWPRRHRRSLLRGSSLFARRFGAHGTATTRYRGRRNDRHRQILQNGCGHPMTVPLIVRVPTRLGATWRYGEPVRWDVVQNGWGPAPRGLRR